MEQRSFSATGRRKEAVARVELIPEGKGQLQVNGKSLAEYLCRETLTAHAQEPLAVTDTLGSVNVRCCARGGGVSGQAGAIRLAIARALALMNPDLHHALRKGGFLTRDPREVERKKYGQPKARKRYQYSKR